MKGAGSFILGVMVGALAIGLYRRVEQQLDGESDMELAERMRKYMGELEARTASVPQPAKAPTKRKTSR